MAYRSINTVNSSGNSLLHSLLMQSIPLKDKMKLLESLLATGIDADLQNANSMTALHIAIEQNQEFAIPLLIAAMKNPQAKDALDRTPLHLAAYLNKNEAIRQLLLDNRIKEGLALVDYTGSSALEIACRVKANEAILAFLGKDFSQTELAALPYYGKRLPIIDQVHLNQQLMNYLKLNNQDESLLSEEGQCAGWGFLFLLMASLGREEEFFEILYLISSWDGSLHGPQGFSTMALPVILQKNYNSVAEVFEQTLNDIVLLSARKLPEAIKETFKNKFHVQHNRIEQYALIKSKNDLRNMHKLFSFHASYTLEQLKELLTLIHQFPNSYVDIGGGRHTTSLFINEAKRSFYYDSNLSHRVVRDFVNYEDLASFIIKTKYPSFLINSHNKIQIELDVFQFHPAPTIKFNPIEPSPNSFNSLHYAIFTNNRLWIKEQLNEEVNNLSLPDASEKTPFDYAVLFQRYDCLDLIIALNPSSLNLSDYVIRFVDVMHDEEVWDPLGQEKKDALNYILKNYADRLDRDVLLDKLCKYRQDQWLNCFQENLKINGIKKS